MLLQIDRLPEIPPDVRPVESTALLKDQNPRNFQRFADWAEENLYLTGDKHGRPGPFRWDPWQREIAECMDDPAVVKLTIKAASQLGKSLPIAGRFLYTADVTKYPIAFASATDELLQSFVEYKLKPIVESCPKLAGQVRITKNRVYFPGGSIPLSNARGIGQLKGLTLREAYSDEVSEFPPLKDASNPLGLFHQRLQSFVDGRVLALDSSTPSQEGLCLVSYMYERSDQRKYHVQCPNMEDRWVVWEYGDVQKARGKWRLYCPACGEEVSEEDRLLMIRERGQWTPLNAGEAEAGHRGYHASQLISMTSSIDETFQSHDEDSLMVFMTQKMAEAFSNNEEPAPTPEKLALLHGLPAPDERVRMRTIGADTQGDRIEFLVTDWYGTWFEPKMRFITQQVVPMEGDDEVGMFRAAVRAMLGFRPDLAMWDSASGKGGDYVVNMLRRVAPTVLLQGLIVPIKGNNLVDSRRWEMEGIIHRGLTRETRQQGETVLLNSAVIKRRLVPVYGRADPELLTMEGAERFPSTFLEQLCSERLDRVVQAGPGGVATGVEKLIWRKVRPSARNEALDCGNYAYGAHEFLGPDYRRGPVRVRKQFR